MKLVWFRRDLRAVDNLALQAAIASGESVVAIFVATPEQWQNHHLAPIQADFIFRRLKALQAELRQLNVALLYHETNNYQSCAEFIADLAKRNHFSEVLCNKDYELNEVLRDNYLGELLEQSDIQLSGFDDKCILPPGSVINGKGDYFKVFTPFKKAWVKSLSIPTIHPQSQALAVNLSPELVKYEFCEMAQFSYPRVPSHEWPVTFDEIRAELRQFCLVDVDYYHERRDYPQQDKTSRLSPYLALGILSARQCIARLFACAGETGLSAGAQVWLGELIWREFYQHLLYFRPELAKGESFHDWGRRLVWNNNLEWFERWKQGRTGFPIVDAAMRQLNQTGWMHNRLRMIVASFLTKDLHIHWRWGEDYFMSKLIDGDYAANNGGWQWCASTGCDGQPYFRIFNPLTQSERFDPQGEFIRHWLPELEQVPTPFIHTPWEWANVSCLSYPEPIVDHKQERALTLSIYKEAKDS